jgi:Ca-activated chloride channel family protein
MATRTRSRVVLTLAAALAGSAGLAAALPASVPQPATEPAPHPARPDVRIIVPQRGRAVASVCHVSGVDAEARIAGAVATTTLKMTVANPGRQRAEARIVLPVPAGAAIRTFGIDGLGDEPTAELLPRDEATRRYREIVSRMTDPGLLEFVGTDLIQSSVFPVEPGAERVVTVVYEHAMPSHMGRVEYVLPRSASMDAAAGWSLTVEVEPGDGLGPVFSPTHPVVTKDLGDKGVRITVPSMDEPGPFRLYAANGPDAGSATCLLYPDQAGGGYFVFIGDAPEPAATEPMPRELTIVLDRSGSMNGDKILQARESARQLVSGLRPGERFNIIDYADDIRAFAPGPVEKSDATLKDALAYIDAIRARGGTNLHDALVESLRGPLAQGHLGVVLFLTDGLPTTGVTAEPAIREAAVKHNSAERRVFTFGLGLDVNAPLLDAIAADTRAESTFVLPREDVELKVSQVFDKLDGPVIVSPVFTTHATDGTPVEQRVNPTISYVHPESLGDVFRGSRVMIVGRYGDTGPLTLRVAPEGGDGPAIEAMLDPSEATARHGFVPRLWAQRRIDALLTTIRADAADGSEPNTELVDEVVRLSLEHGIMTEYTAFLAAEDVSLAAAAAPRDADGDVGFGFAATRRAVQTANTQRSGREGVSQTVNRKDTDAMVLQDQMITDGAGERLGRVESFAVKSNRYYDADMKLQAVQTVQRQQDGTLYRKTDRWVDARLGEHADEAPEQVVEFGTDAYWALLADLAGQGRQWMLANRGEVYLLNHDQRVLVKNPT